MISIIMPTLWKGEHYKKMLPQLNLHPLVGEIIIVDNDTNSTNKEILKLDKIKHLPQSENIYVNPAWNLAVKEIRFDSLCLYSDDVFFDINVLDSIHPLLIPENGIFTFSNDSIFVSEEQIYIAEWEQKNITPSVGFHYRSGICMFMHKESYYPIPKNYKVYYGDTHLFDSNILNGKQNYEIQNYVCVTKMKTTSRFFDKIAEEDHKQYKESNPLEGILIDLMDRSTESH